MKFDNLRAFEKHLRACLPNQFADAYLILSKEDFDRTRAVELTLEALLKGTSADLALVTFDGDDVSADKLLDELNTLPFLTDRRIVLVTRADKMKKAVTKAIEEYLNHPNRAVKLVMAAEAVAANTTFYKRSEKTGVVLALPPKKPWEKEKEFYDWVQEQVTQAGKRIEPSAIQMLVKQTGLDQGLLKMELEKLLCYVGDARDVSATAVGAICTSIDIDTVWQFAEAIFKRDAAKSLTIASHLLNNGTAVIGVLAQLRTQMHTDYQICSILAQGGTPEDVSQEFRYLVGRVLTMHIEMARGYGMQRFKKGLIALDEAERAAKSSAMEPDLLLERLVVQLTA